MARTAKKTKKVVSKKKTNVKVKITKGATAKKSKLSASKPAVKKIVKRKVKVSAEKQTRLEILQSLSDNTGIAKSQVEKVFVELSILMESHLKKKGSGEFTIPYTGVKLKSFKKKAVKAREMYSPLLDKDVKVAARKAKNSVKAVLLKTVKDMAEK